MNKLKEAQIAFIIDEATKLFFSHPISEVKISDIAKDLGIGEATLYRYFGKKSNIVLKCAEKLSTNVFTNFFKVDTSKSGYERIKDFYYSYLEIFQKEKNYYSFIYYFDSYILNETDLNLSNYNDQVDLYKKIFDDAFKAGLEDKSVGFTGDIDLFYRSTTLSLLNLCKKLATEENLIESDKKFDSCEEIKTLIEIFLYRIKK